jgi:predicted dehydrogenase
MPSIAHLLNQLASGIIGELKMISIREHRFPFLVKVDNWNRFTANTGGTLVEKCCHFFDLMNFVSGSRPTRVYASGGQDVNHLDEVYNGQRSDILDNAFVTVDYANGVRAMLDLSMFAEGGRNEQELVVVGDAGKIEAAVPGDGHLYIGKRADRSVRADPLRRFISAVNGEGEVEVTTTDGLWSVVIGAAAHLSIDEGRAVDISEFKLS